MYYFTILLFEITLQYFPLNYDVSFLQLKQIEIHSSYYYIAFFTHVYSSIFVLIAGSIQFSNRIRDKYKSLHRWTGKIYVMLIILFSFPSGLIMSYHANGGWIARISFIVLSLLWFYFTFQAWAKAKNKDFVNHQKFMIRSYALTLSAISLRLFKFIIIYLFETPPMDTYQIVSILGWSFNLFIAEILIWQMNLKNNPPVLND